MCCAVRLIDEEYFERLHRVNCVDLIRSNYHGLERCFVEIGSRELVEEFVYTCKKAATYNLWTHIEIVCDALNSTLRQINVATGRRSLDVLQYAYICLSSENYEQPSMGVV